MNIAGVWRNHRLLLVPALLALCCFVNTLNYTFVSDDRNIVTDAGPILQDWSSANMARLFKKDIWGFFHQNSNLNWKYHSPYYRPVFGLAFMIDYSLLGPNPLGWHLTALLLHSLSVIFAYFLLLASLRAAGACAGKKEARLLAMLGAAFFAIHPAQSESVAWVAAYVNALSSIFIFGSLLAYLRARTESAKSDQKEIRINPSWLALSASLYVVALLTKEAAIIVPAIIAAYELLIVGRKEAWRSRLRAGVLIGLPFLLLTLGYFALRIAIFGTIRPSAISADFPDMREVPLMVNLFTLPTIILKYLKIIVSPFSLSPMYEIQYVRSPQFWNFFAPVAFLIALALLSILAARQSRLLRIGLIWLIVPLLPMLDVRSFSREMLVQDRYLYLSILGAGLLFSALCRRLIEMANSKRVADLVAGKDMNADPVQLKSPLYLIPVLLLVLLMIGVTIRHNAVWSDEWSLWSTVRESVPGSCTANMQLGRLSEDSGQDRDAINYYEQAMRGCPNSERGNYKLGMLYGRVGDLIHAEAAFQRVAASDLDRSMRATAYFNLGVIYEKKGDLDRAIGSYKEGLVLDPLSKNAPEARRIIDELNQKLEINYILDE